MTNTHTGADSTLPISHENMLDSRSAQITNPELSQQLWNRQEMKQPDRTPVIDIATTANKPGPGNNLDLSYANQDRYMAQLGFPSFAQDSGLRNLLTQNDAAPDAAKGIFQPSAADIDQLRKDAKTKGWSDESETLWNQLFDKISNSYPDGISHAEALKQLENIANRINATEKNPDGSPRVSIYARTDEHGDIHFYAMLSHSKADYQRNINDAKRGRDSDTIIDLGYFEGTDLSNVG